MSEMVMMTISPVQRWMPHIHHSTVRHFPHKDMSEFWPQMLKFCHAFVRMNDRKFRFDSAKDMNKHC